MLKRALAADTLQAVFGICIQDDTEPSALLLGTLQETLQSLWRNRRVLPPKTQPQGFSSSQQHLAVPPCHEAAPIRQMPVRPYILIGKTAVGGAPFQLGRKIRRLDTLRLHGQRFERIQPCAAHQAEQFEVRPHCGQTRQQLRAFRNANQTYCLVLSGWVVLEMPTDEISGILRPHGE